MIINAFKKFIAWLKFFFRDPLPVSEMEAIPTVIDITGIPLESAKMDVKMALDQLRSSDKNRLLMFKISGDTERTQVEELYKYIFLQNLPYGHFFYSEEIEIRFVDVKELRE